MPTDLGVARALANTLMGGGYIVAGPVDETSNPFQLEIEAPISRAFMVHIRVIKRQGSATSNHNRPPNEWHAELKFDDDRPPPRGARGYTFRLRRTDRAQPLVLGYVDWPPSSPDDRLYVAYDPRRHDPYTHYKSLQVKAEVLDDALQHGMRLHRRTNGEIIVAMRSDALPTYISQPESWHDLTKSDLVTLATAVERTLAVELTELIPSRDARERRTVTYARLVRLKAFSVALRAVYERCAICSFACGPLLQAAHIIPVTDPTSTDTYDNGLGLCPLCHGLYDTGLVLVDGNASIVLNHARIGRLAQEGQTLDVVVLSGRLRSSLYQPADPRHRPSSTKLEATYNARSGS